MNKTLLVSVVILVSIALFVTHLHVSAVDDRMADPVFPGQEPITIPQPTQNMEDPNDDNYTETCHFIPNTIHANFTDDGQVITTEDDCD